MFGLLKENILHKLNQSKGNPTTLKKNFASFITTLKENKGLYELYEMYDMVESARFDNEAIAKEFLDECLTQAASIKDKHLRGKDGFASMRTMAEGMNVKPSAIAASLDKLIFENTNLKEKYEEKSRLIKSLTDKTQKPDFKEMINNLDKKVNNQVSKLTAEQKEALDLFIENDNSKIEVYYNNLIETTIGAIETMLMNEESVDINKTLIAAKRKLQGFKEQKANLDAIDSIIELKAGLDA